MEIMIEFNSMKEVKAKINAFLELYGVAPSIYVRGVFNRASGKGSPIPLFGLDHKADDTGIGKGKILNVSNGNGKQILITLRGGNPDPHFSQVIILKGD